MRHLLHRLLFTFLCCGLVALACPGVVSAQYGTAPNNYYPEAYHGATFTGTVTQINNDAITLTYTHGSKTDTFEGYVAARCNLPSTRTTIVKKGAVITVFYEPETTKTNGQKLKKNRILGISFQEVDGNKIAENQRGIFYCMPSPSFQMQFKAFQ
jgi:hypothetical protein